MYQRNNYHHLWYDTKQKWEMINREREGKKPFQRNDGREWYGTCRKRLHRSVDLQQQIRMFAIEHSCLSEKENIRTIFTNGKIRDFYEEILGIFFVFFKAHASSYDG